MTRIRKIGRPSKPGTVIHIRINPALRERIDRIHEQEQPTIGSISLNAVVNFLLEKGVKEYEKERKT